ncbi:MAG: response regulator transcription factor [Nanoarchaeota archaeon]
MAKKILIAEDEENIVELLKLILSDDYKIDVVKDGKQTLSYIKKNKPDLLILDVMMPNLNGFEVCEKLKHDEKTKDIKIAMLSAKGQKRDILGGLQRGADYYITKPFDPEELKEKIREILK